MITAIIVWIFSMIWINFIVRHPCSHNNRRHTPMFTAIFHNPAGRITACAIYSPDLRVSLSTKDARRVLQTFTEYCFAKYHTFYSKIDSYPANKLLLVLIIGSHGTEIICSRLQYVQRDLTQCYMWNGEVLDNGIFWRFSNGVTAVLR